MTITGTVLMSRKSDEGLTGPAGTVYYIHDASNMHHKKKMTSAEVTAIVLIMVIDIVLICLAIHYILKCSKVRGWGTGMAVLLIILMFMPYIGPIVIFGMIGYGVLAGCNPAAGSSSFTLPSQSLARSPSLRRGEAMQFAFF